MKCNWIPCEQGTPEWVQARLGRVTASRFAEVMANGRGSAMSKSAQTYMMDLIAEDLTGKPADEIKAKQLEWGKKHEPGARAAYSWVTGNPVDQVGVAVHARFPHVAASSDGLIGAEGAVEIKCPWNSKVHLQTLLRRAVPRDYQWQVHGGLWVLDRQWCDFVSYDPRMPESHQLCIVRVQRDEEKIRELETRIEQFLGEMADLTDRINESAETGVIASEQS